MPDRVRFAARVLGYVGAVLIALDIAWVAGAAHIATISAHQYTAGMILLTALAALCLTVTAGVAGIAAGVQHLDRQAEQREEKRMVAVAEMHRDRAVHEDRIEDTQSLIADELVTIHALGTAAVNSTGSLPEVGRLLMAVRAEVEASRKELAGVATQTAETSRDLHLLRTALVETNPGLGNRLADDFAKYLREHDGQDTAGA